MGKIRNSKFPKMAKKSLKIKKLTWSHIRWEKSEILNFLKWLQSHWKWKKTYKMIQNLKIQIDFASRFPPRHFEASRLCGLHVLDRNRHQKRFSTKTIPSGMNPKTFTVLWRPKGPNQTLCIRILDRYVFSIISTSEGHLDYIRRSFRLHPEVIWTTSGGHLDYIWK